MINFSTYDFFTDAVFVVDSQNNICYANSAFLEDYSNVKNDINRLIPYFDFDICILDNSQIMETTPISLAINSKENYSCSAHNVQTGMIYEIFSIKKDEYKIIILKSQKEDTSEFDKKIKELESENKKAEQLKQQAQTQAAKIGLLNRIYTIIQKENELDDILKLAYEELMQVFGAEKLFFAQKNDLNFEITTIFPKEFEFAKNKNFDYEIKTNQVYEAKTHIIEFASITEDKQSHKNSVSVIIPVNDRQKLLGILCFNLPQRNFSIIDEDFLTSLCSQLSAAVLQAILSQQLKENQLQLINSEKMATLGNMIAVVAHEINTPIGAISSNNEIASKLVDKYIKNKEQDDKTLKMIKTSLDCDKEAIKRIMSIVQALKKFIRLDEAKMQLTDVSKEMDLTIDLCQHLLKNRITIEKNYEDIPQIYTHPNMLNQVLMNLITNAAQSIENKGFINIHTYKENKNIVIAIKDNGCGIKEEDKGKIFQQGFTTKTKDKGTGLGLSISKKIVEQLGGELSFESKENEGSVFFVKLPDRETE